MNAAAQTISIIQASGRLILVPDGRSTAMIAFIIGIWLTLAAFLFVMAAARSSTPKRWFAALAEAWDWPRKRDGGGETQKLKDGIASAFLRPAQAGGVA